MTFSKLLERLRYRGLWLLSFVRPVRMGVGITTTTGEMVSVSKEKKSGFPIYRLDPDLRFIFDSYSRDGQATKVRLRVAGEARTISLSKELFELFFKQDQ